MSYESEAAIMIVAFLLYPLSFILLSFILYLFQEQLHPFSL